MPASAGDPEPAVIDTETDNETNEDGDNHNHPRSPSVKEIPDPNETGEEELSSSLAINYVNDTEY